MKNTQAEAEAVLFDLDGTLWDAIDCCVDAWNSVLGARGGDLRRVSRSDFLGSMGKNHAQIREVYFTVLPLSEREGLIHECYAREIPQIMSGRPLIYPGVRDGIRRLAERRDLAIVSNCQRAYLNAFLEKSGLGPCFRETLCYQDTELSKGQNIVAVMKKLGVQSCAYVGDTLGDEQAAREARVPFYFAEYGFGHSDSHVRAFQDFGDLTAYFA